MKKEVNLTFELIKKKNIKKFSVPFSILQNRKLGLLESLTKYLKDKYKLTYHEIGILLNRDERNIWTSYHQAIRKLKER